MGARIVAIVDAFDAMVSDRCYRTGLPLDEASARREAGSAKQFDPVIVDRFVALARRDIAAIPDLREPARASLIPAP